MKLKHFLTLAVAALFVGLALYAWHLGNKVKELTNQDPVTVIDTVTLTNWQYDTVYYTNTKVETLKVVDTNWLTDTLTDSVYVKVEVPIYTYVFDTLISTDTTQTHLRAVLEGMEVRLDTFTIDWKIMHQEAEKAPKKWYQHLGPSLGVGYGTGGWGAFVGVGYVF